MLNGIWGFFLIGGILTGAFLGRMDMVTGAILSGGRSAVELALGRGNFGLVGGAEDCGAGRHD